MKKTKKAAPKSNSAAANVENHSLLGPIPLNIKPSNQNNLIPLTDDRIILPSKGCCPGIIQRIIDPGQAMPIYQTQSIPLKKTKNLPMTQNNTKPSNQPQEKPILKAKFAVLDPNKLIPSYQPPFILPPQQIEKTETNKKTRNNLPKTVTNALTQWLINHATHPYPSELEKRYFMVKFGLTKKQINTWFVNNRMRNSFLHPTKIINNDITEV